VITAITVYLLGIQCKHPNRFLQIQSDAVGSNSRSDSFGTDLVSVTRKNEEKMKGRRKLLYLNDIGSAIQ